ncbi:hypothetical protein [Actinocatenispora rupis]|uniref:Uncharacterized protein n=1 Tax=Actinocatenispora rupis TaxID=519421 RepID=A0A8J3IXE5_9ACTN|nr:hypothetical protein Aru02nite_13220 [Actinocatenispora rupis]
MSVLAAGLPLAQNNFGDTEAGGLAGPLGLVVIVFLAIATVLLIRNMNRRLRRLPDRFDSTSTPDGGLPQTDDSRQDHSGEDHSDQGEAVGDVSAESRSESADQDR